MKEKGKGKNTLNGGKELILEKKKEVNPKPRKAQSISRKKRK